MRFWKLTNLPLLMMAVVLLATPAVLGTPVHFFAQGPCEEDDITRFISAESVSLSTSTSTARAEGEEGSSNDSAESSFLSSSSIASFFFSSSSPVSSSTRRSPTSSTSPLFGTMSDEGTPCGPSGRGRIVRAQLQYRDRHVNQFETIYTIDGFPEALVVDAPSGRLFWALEDGSVWRGTVDGDPVEQVSSPELEAVSTAPRGLASDSRTRSVYWTYKKLDNDSSITPDGIEERAFGVGSWSKKEGGFEKELTRVGQEQPRGIAIDSREGMMYFSDGSTLYSAALDRREEAPHALSHDPRALTLSVDRTFRNGDDSRSQVSPDNPSRDTPTVEEILETGYILDVQVLGDYLYWACYHGDSRTVSILAGKRRPTDVLVTLVWTFEDVINGQDASVDLDPYARVLLVVCPYHRDGLGKTYFVPLAEDGSISAWTEPKEVVTIPALRDVTVYETSDDPMLMLAVLGCLSGIALLMAGLKTVTEWWRRVSTDDDVTEPLLL